MPVNSDLIHQVVVSQMANRRRDIAHTKDRSEVRGGGRKPWVQKGTGRARHGSIRSPLWRGGGVTFGPRKDKVFKKQIPKKMRKKALFMVLTGKMRNNLLLLIDEMKIETGKTKDVFNILKKLPVKGSVLIAQPYYDKRLVLATRNIPEVETMEARELNVLDLLSFKYLVMPKESVEVIKRTFLKSKAQMSNVKSNPND